MNVAFQWMDQRCSVEAPRAVAQDVAALFPALVVPASSSEAARIRVSGDAGSFVVEGEQGGTVCNGHPQAVSAVELLVTRRLMAGETRHCHLHASAALAWSEDGGCAVLAAGVSGRGKSTLAYAWHRMGLGVFGDDVIAVDDQARIHAFPRPLKVDVARLREAGDAPERTVAWDPEASDAWVVPAPEGGWAKGGVPVGVLAEIRFVAGSPGTVEPVAGAERLRVLLNAQHQTGAQPPQALDRLIRLAESSDVYRVDFGDARDAAVLLVELARAARG